jgi:hypothetical protein
MRLAPKERRQTRAGKAVAFTKGTKFLKAEGTAVHSGLDP